MSAKIKKTEAIQIDGNKIVTLMTAGNTSKITFTEKKNTQCPIIKLNENEYADRNTGEVKEFNHTNDRSESINWLRKTMEHGRDMINANCTDLECCLFVTVTYAQRKHLSEECKPMTDTRKLYHDLDVFQKRFRRKYGSEIRYITCAEPQGNGSWHAHIIYIFPNKYPFIEKSEIERMWEHGFVTVKRVTSVDNAGAYLTSYLTNISLDELENKTEKDVFSGDVPKRIKKGLRLYLYPPYFHPFRFSKNCIRPKTKTMRYKEAQKLLTGQSLTFVCAVSVVDEDGVEINRSQKEYYKKAGKNHEK